MAKAKDLAGLAALGALGYYLKNRGDDQAQVKGATTTAADTEDVNPAQAAATSGRDDLGEGTQAASTPVRAAPAKARPRSIGAKAAEAAASTTADASTSLAPRADARDLEAGMSRGTRNTSMAGAGRGVTVPTRPAAVVTNNTEEGMRNYKPRYTPPGSLPVSTGGRRSEEDVAPLRYQSLQDRARAYEDERAKSRVGMYGAAFKKGGAVKAKTPTASKRADGIASRGKTRGKIY